MNLPVLYSFRRCPYAIRARMAMQWVASLGFADQVRCQLREVVLKNKPAEMLAISPKATVPVLQLSDRVIDESIDIMVWALQHCAQVNTAELSHPLVLRNDHEFKPVLDRYKYFDRFPEHSQEDYLQACLPFLIDLDASINQQYLLTSELSPVDLAVFPFVRQFAFVDKQIFEGLPLANLQCWLNSMLQHPIFLAVMEKYQPWQSSDEAVLFPAS